MYYINVLCLELGVVNEERSFLGKKFTTTSLKVSKSKSKTNVKWARSLNQIKTCLIFNSFDLTN